MQSMTYLIAQFGTLLWFALAVVLFVLESFVPGVHFLWFGVSAAVVGLIAFVVPIAFALYRVGVSPARLAADPVSMRLMVLATREAFTALRANGNDEVPTNLRVLYRLPTRIVIGYWRRVLNGPRGELWFGAHSRAAPEEMRDLAEKLQETLLQTGRPTPDLNKLLTPRL